MDTNNPFSLYSLMDSYVTYTPLNYIQKETVEPEKKQDLLSDIQSIKAMNLEQIMFPKETVEVSKNEGEDLFEQVQTAQTTSSTSASSFSTSTSSSNGNLDISFKELAEQENLPVIITSGYRPNASNPNSYHRQKDSRGYSKAFDIQPSWDGGKTASKSAEDFKKLRNILYSNQRVVAWLNHNKMGILEENTPQMMKKYSSTGPHFHIGPDRAALAMRNQAFAQYSNTGNKKTNFINKFKPVIAQELSRQGISTAYTNNLLAQLALESAWGTKRSGKNNYGGITGTSGTTIKTPEYINGRYQLRNQTFKDYDSLEAFIRDYVDKLKTRFDAFSGGDFIHNVLKRGYATDPNYAEKYRKTYNSIV